MNEYRKKAVLAIVELAALRGSVLTTEKAEMVLDEQFRRAEEKVLLGTGEQHSRPHGILSRT